MSGSTSWCSANMIRDVEVRDAGQKGKGVFALRDLEQGEFIFRRRHGQIVQNSKRTPLCALAPHHAPCVAS
jgi:hypothetical protein